MLETTVGAIISRHFSGPSPDCEERPVRSFNEWGVLKTTAITWDGWDASAHKVLPRPYWNQPQLEVRSGDVLVTKAGPRHRCAVVVHVDECPPRLIVSGKMIGLRPRNDVVLPQILSGLLALPEPQKYLDARTTGMAESQVNFTNSVLLSVPLRIPSLPQQRRIADILDAADAAIRQTEAVIAKLRQMKAGLLNDLMTRGLDEQGHLRNPRRYPEQFKDSRLGLVPTAWGVCSLGDMLERPPKNGYSPQEVAEWTGTLMLGLGCLTPDGFKPHQLKNAPRGDSGVRNALLGDGDLLLTRSNTRDLVGMVGVYRDIGVPCIYPDLMMRLTPKPVVVVRWLELALRSPLVRRQLTNAAVGTSGSMLKINSSSVMEVRIACPEPDEQRRIVETVAVSDARLQAEEANRDKLQLQKRGLMHDLLTGRVRV